MQIIHGLENFPPELRGGAVSIGNFDGVHRGHALLVEKIVSARGNAPAVVVTFDPHPACVLHPEKAPPPLTWLSRKARLLGKLGVDVVLAVHTDLDLLQWSAECFFKNVLCETLHARMVVEGFNFLFGCNRAGNVALLGDLCSRSGMKLEVVKPLTFNGEVVSSSFIRSLIAHGDVHTASKLLTAPYRVRGTVVHGLARGRTLGFPTANLVGIDTLLPSSGVYACMALVDGRAWPAAVHIGPNITFQEHVPKVEAHMIGFSGDIYGQIVKLDFYERLRDIQTFSAPEKLVAQIHEDNIQTVAVTPDPLLFNP